MGHQIFEVLTLGLILSADSFSAAVAMGARRFSVSDLLIFAVASGGAEAVSTLLGHVAGTKVIAQISEYDHWVAFGLLAAVAAHMAWEGIQGLRTGPVPDEPRAFHSLTKILIISFATSLDAFGVGIGLGVANRPIWPFVVSIAAWAFGATVIGLFIGNRISRKLGPVFTLLAAIVLGVLSIQMLKI